MSLEGSFLSPVITTFRCNHSFDSPSKSEHTLFNCCLPKPANGITVGIWRDATLGCLE